MSPPSVSAVPCTVVSLALFIIIFLCSPMSCVKSIDDQQMCKKMGCAFPRLVSVDT
jgi:hypothetical protein